MWQAYRGFRSAIAAWIMHLEDERVYLVHWETGQYYLYFNYSPQGPLTEERYRWYLDHPVDIRMESVL